jgi:hypothetical protein
MRSPFALLFVSLCAIACSDTTSPPVNHGSAHYTVTLLPANTSSVIDDNAYFLLYRAGPASSVDLGIIFGMHLEFDQCGLTSMAAVPGQYPVNGMGIVCNAGTLTPILLASGALVPGVVDQSSSTMTITPNGTDRLDGTFVINFHSSSGTPTGRIEGSFSATVHPCQSKVGSDGQFTAPCTLPQ